MTGRVSAAGARASNASRVASAGAHKTTASEAAMTVGSARSVHTVDGDAALDVTGSGGRAPSAASPQQPIVVGGAEGEGEADRDADADAEAQAEPEFTVDEDGVQSNELEVLQLGEGAFFGERALLSNGESIVVMESVVQP